MFQYLLPAIVVIFLQEETTNEEVTRTRRHVRYRFSRLR